MTNHIKSISEMTNESVSDTINRIGIITEMAVPLKKYRERVDGFRFQLVENWCLSKYCQLFDDTNLNYKHWITELKSCIDNLKFLYIKDDISKKKVLKKMLILDYDYKKSSMIKLITAGKFKKENILDSEKIETVCLAFTNDIDNIINTISDNNIIIDDYIQNTFKLTKYKR